MARSRENRQVVFRRIGGHVVPIALGAGSATAGVKSITDHRVVGRYLHRAFVNRKPEFETAAQAARFKKAFVRKYGEHIKRIDTGVSVAPRVGFWGSQWQDIVQGKTGAMTNSTPDLVAMKRKISIGVTRRDLTSALHELGHAEQFRTNSKSVRWRYMSDNRIVRRLGYTANELGAYARGVRMAKGTARLSVAKEAFFRATINPAAVKSAGAALAVAGAGAIGYGLAGLLKKPKTK